MNRENAVVTALLAIVIFLTVAAATIALGPWTKREAVLAAAFFVTGLVAMPLASWITRRIGL